MLYRLIFSFIPIIVFPRLGFGIILSLIVVAMLLIGTIIGNNRWIPQLQSLTIFLIYALPILGYFRGQDISVMSISLMLIAFGYLSLGIEGSAFSLPVKSKTRKKVALFASVLFAFFVAWGLSILAFDKMGNSGVFLSAFLMGLVAWRDVNRIIKSSFEERRQSEN
ncbi:hypothetical protein AT15_07670 [Kosmotoga arenicorallina S304]|uniref:Uncharacterized protein n=1 Tax=Kosmotoga arenicorallina S304 TaxID=1453497 RepID=A0A176K2C8_9BACT|nr:hypothetical protein [Kosmotoga arenicorallina]OAA31366.1 hypothetical protein AT15_07670 [Kosmotoga arenicorallina S304]